MYSSINLINLTSIMRVCGIINKMEYTAEERRKQENAATAKMVRYLIT